MKARERLATATSGEFSQPGDPPRSHPGQMSQSTASYHTPTVLPSATTSTVRGGRETTMEKVPPSLVCLLTSPFFSSSTLALTVAPRFSSLT